MEHTKLIMLEGLPGTGKSTNAYFLLRQLERAGKRARWFHEVARPHPVLFFDEACLSRAEYGAFVRSFPRAQPVLNRVAAYRKNAVGIDLLEIEWNYGEEIGTEALEALRKFDVCMKFPLDLYEEIALEKWACFVERALRVEDRVYLLDSAIFQYQIFTYLLKNAPYEALERLIGRLMDVVRPLNPCLVYFNRENTRDTISFLEETRGKDFMEWMGARDANEPYYGGRPGGAEGHRHFLMDYGDIARRLFERADCRKLGIEVSGQDWPTLENALLAFLGMKRMEDAHALPPDGVYQNEPLGMEIAVDGLSITDPTGKRRALVAKSDREFYVDCLPTVLKFDGAGAMTIAGGQICEQWTTVGTRYVEKNRAMPGGTGE